MTVLRRFSVMALVVASLSAAATTVPPMTPAQVRTAADVVVDGVVVTCESRWVGQRIITFVSVVSGSGPSLQATLVAVPGGVVDGIAQVVPGAPRLEVGGRYRLFLGTATGPRLDGRGPASRGIVGFFRGVFVLDDDAPPLPFGDDGQPLGIR